MQIEKHAHYAPTFTYDVIAYLDTAPPLEDLPLWFSAEVPKEELACWMIQDTERSDEVERYRGRHIYGNLHPFDLEMYRKTDPEISNLFTQLYGERNWCKRFVVRYKGTTTASECQEIYLRAFEMPEEAI